VKAAAASSAQAKSADTARLRQAAESIRDDTSTTNLSPQDQEQYFLENVSIGEALAARGLYDLDFPNTVRLTWVFITIGPQFHVDAAISFFKALRVYPAPHDLIQIYQKTLPPAVFE